MGEYANSVDSFLILFYNQLSKKMSELKSIKNIKEREELKSKMLEALDMLTMSAQDEKFKNFSEFLATKIILNKFDEVKEICDTVKQGV